MLTFYCLLSQKWLLHTTFYFRKVRMHVHTNNKITRIYNVIGILRGAVEPGEKWVLDNFNPSFILCLVKLFSCCKKLCFLDSQIMWNLRIVNSSLPGITLFFIGIPKNIFECKCYDRCQGIFFVAPVILQ